MKQTILISVLLFGFCISALPQKLNEPVLFGNLFAGEDPSEFYYHDVGETSDRFLKDNPEGKLVVRICSSDDFLTALIKAPFNPLWGNYTAFVPDEKIFISKSSKCLDERKFVSNQYWFVPDKITLEYDEIFPVKDIFYKDFDVDDYDFNTNKRLKTSVEEKEFTENINKFIKELKDNSKAEGFIVHNSKNETMKRNVAKVTKLLEKENISSQRVKTVLKVRLTTDENLKLVPIKDQKRYFPVLEILSIKNKNE
jgi:hypothetical protein